MNPVGRQLVAEFLQCSKKILNNPKELEKTLKQGIKKCGLTLKSLSSQEFSPVGITTVAVISESHVVIHTYPEAHHSSIDIFTCSTNSQIPKMLLNFLKTKFNPSTVRVIELYRGNTLEIKENDWIVDFSPIGSDTRYHIKKKIFSKKTKYQQIDIIENEDFGRMLFLDKELQIAEKDAHIYNQDIVLPIINYQKNLGRIAILGGGDGGVLHELLKHKPKSVFLVDIDREVISASKKFLKKVCKNAFSNPRVKIIIDDANHFLDKNNGFDAIIYDLTMYPYALTRMDRISFLNEIFSRIKNSLNNKGVISVQCCSEFDIETLQILQKILSKYFTNLVFKKYFIPSFCENWIFALARK